LGGLLDYIHVDSFVNFSQFIFLTFPRFCMQVLLLMRNLIVNLSSPEFEPMLGRRGCGSFVVPTSPGERENIE
ncbi:hypothetical protein HN51_055682, partial [Arachis hypogaea]